VSVRRSPLRASRVLVSVGLAAAVALLPGTALADQTPSLPDAIGGVTGGLPGGTGDTGSTGSAGTAGTGDQAPAADSGAPELPPELADALDQLAASLGASQECRDGVQASIELIIEGLTDIPAELQTQLEGLLAQLQDMSSAGPPDAASLEELQTAIEDALAGGGTVPGANDAPDPADSKIVQGLQELGQTLSEKCMPAPPVVAGNPPPSQTPPATPTQTTQPAPAPAAQPVVYPGYAPTGGAGVEERSSSGPLAALGGTVLLIGAAAAAGHRRRGRAVPSQD
jgi:hypothetical protein